MQYTKEEYEIAKTVSCIDYLEKNGYKLQKHGNAHQKLVEHDSFIVKNDGSCFYWNSKGVQGNVIQMVETLENKDFKEAIVTLAREGYSREYRPNQNIRNAVELKQVEKKGLKLPEKNQSIKKAYWYLTDKRKIDPNIVNYAIRKNMIYQDSKGNVVFVSKDKNNTPKYACFRGTYEKVYRGDIAGSDKSYGFSLINTKSNVLHVTESVIDTLSWASIKGNINDNYLSLNGTYIKALDRFLKDNPNIDTIITGLDNDDAGKEATIEIWRTYKDKYKLKYKHFVCKDINEQLVNIRSDTNIIVTECNIESVELNSKISLSKLEENLDNVQGFFNAKINLYQGEVLLYENLTIDNKDLLNINKLSELLKFETNEKMDTLREKLSSCEPSESKSIKLELLEEKSKIEMLEKAIEMKDEKQLRIEKSNNLIKESER